MAVVKRARLVSTQTDELLRAAEMVTQILKTTTARSLADLYARIEAGDEKVIAKLDTIELSDEQVALIEVNGGDLALLRTLTTVSLQRCPNCGAVSAVTGTGTRRCNLTIACEGIPVKSGVARKVALDA